jgi:hypothetical protein
MIGTGPADRRLRESARTGTRRFSTRGARERQIAAEPVTNEARVQMAKALVEKRFREMLGLPPARERTQPPKTRDGPGAKIGQGRTTRFDESQEEVPHHRGHRGHGGEKI